MRPKHCYERTCYVGASRYLRSPLKPANVRNRSSTSALLYVAAAFIVVGCVKNGVLTEDGQTAARQYASIQGSPYTGEVEKFEEGKLIAQFPGAETLQGTYMGYRPKQGPHCTKSWLAGLRADSTTTVVPAFERGYVTLAGASGTGVHCFYSWTTPECQREGVCKSDDGRYFRLEF